ncbi:hypothetical protein C8R31_10578 [Nitrosospira sp. Nsp2]|nr:hypothetical protein C8R31_10578 [Nitrosospira sp. Nsp2]
MEIWPKNYDAARVLILDKEVRTEGTMLISIEYDGGNVSEPVFKKRRNCLTADQRWWLRYRG